MGAKMGRHICQTLRPRNRGREEDDPAATFTSSGCRASAWWKSGKQSLSQDSKCGSFNSGIFARSLGESDFEFLHCIGKGTFGRVFLVRKRRDKHHRLLAMKVLSKSAVADSRRRADYVMTERKVLRVANHPFVAKLRFAFQSPTRLYLVTDFFRGGELLYYMRKTGRFDEPTAQFFAVEVCLGLDYLHSKGICHRDLKPENIILDDCGHIRLTDFGLSKMGLEGEAVTSTLCGTPEYLPPEVFKHQSYGCELDWWSFGVLVFEMLEGNPPFRDKNEKRLVELILSGKLHFKHAHSEEVQDFVGCLLRTDPQERIRSALEIQAHPWMGSIDWDAALSKGLTPPFRPGKEIKIRGSGLKCGRPTSMDDGWGMHIPGFTYVPDEDEESNLDDEDLASTASHLSPRSFASRSIYTRSFGRNRSGADSEAEGEPLWKPQFVPGSSTLCRPAPRQNVSNLTRQLGGDMQF